MVVCSVDFNEAAVRELHPAFEFIEAGVPLGRNEVPNPVVRPDDFFLQAVLWADDVAGHVIEAACESHSWIEQRLSSPALSSLPNKDALIALLEDGFDYRLLLRVELLIRMKLRYAVCIRVNESQVLLVSEA